jgi:hypothetical protein
MLCRIKGLSKLSSVIVDESATLLKSDLSENDQCVLLENGPVPTGVQLDTLVIVMSDSAENQRLVDMQPFGIDRRFTIKMVKAFILQHAGIARSESEFCLYRGADAFGIERGKLFQNEHISLQQMKIDHSQILWLVEGKLPSKGMVNLSVFLHSAPQGVNIEPTARFAQLRSELLNQRALLQEMDEEEKTAAEREQRLKLLQDAEAFTVAPLFPNLEFQTELQLADLKMALVSHQMLAEVPPSRLRVRFLNRNFSMGKILTSDSAMLKNQQISSDKQLAVEVLEYNQPDLSTHSLYLRVHVAISAYPGYNMSHLLAIKTVEEEKAKARLVAAQRAEEAHYKALQEKAANAQSQSASVPAPAPAPALVQTATPATELKVEVDQAAAAPSDTAPATSSATTAEVTEEEDLEPPAVGFSPVCISHFFFFFFPSSSLTSFVD